MKVDWHPGVILPAGAGLCQGLVETDPDMDWQMGDRESRANEDREWARET